LSLKNRKLLPKQLTTEQQTGVLPEKLLAKQEQKEQIAAPTVLTELMEVLLEEVTVSLFQELKKPQELR